MHLVSCPPPTPHEPLEAAPQTALLMDHAEGERWDGFWLADTYVLRCTRRGGEVEWYMLADDVDLATHSAEARPQPRNGAVAPDTRSRVNVVVARSPNGHRMLVGSARRSTR
ncbi:MAG TPA: hypothetical protein VGP95_22330 [Gemmatimonadaceae bacterium]|nr:hypothetical protein [Gemmatimonadaceae bacterium]